MGVGGHFLIFLGVAALVIITPGPDMALVTKNALLHGRRAALGTSLGVNAGLTVWTVASALGVASLVLVSATAFTVLKLVGAAYLIWLGVQALRAARAHAVAGGDGGDGAGGGGGDDDDDGGGADTRKAFEARSGFRQGLLSNLANPKIAVFFTSLLPQFVEPGRSVLLPFLLLGGLFVMMTLAWLSAYALLAVKASAVLRRRRVKAALDRLTGVVLIALGLRLATERR
jgi:threonine/homoserine/homoserine lactone efflux protein